MEDPDPSPTQALQIISEGPAVEDGADRFVVHSHRVGRPFQVTVSRPFAAPFVPGQTFPAIVALDDGYGVAGPMARLLGMGWAMAPAMVVSVWYPPEQEEFRNTDLLHLPWTTLYGRTFGGGGAVFEGFLLEDLMPFIVKRFPIERSQIALFGHSAGGLFAANILAHQPDAFAAYVISSAPADQDLARRLDAGLPNARGKRVYLGVGSHEDVYRVAHGDTIYLTGFARLDAALRRAAGVECRSQIYPNEGHVSVYPRVVADAFPFILPPRRPLTAPESKPAARTAGRYVGVYSLPDGRCVRIARTPQGQLAARVADLPEVSLIHFGGNRFYAPTSDLDVLFDRAGFTITGNGGPSWRGVRD